MAVKHICEPYIDRKLVPIVPQDAELWHIKILFFSMLREAAEIKGKDWADRVVKELTERRIMNLSYKQYKNMVAYLRFEIRLKQTA